jgi:hypothetical protein
MKKPNIDYINQISGNDVNFKSKIITILKQELPLQMDAFYYEINNKNYKVAAESVHKLKHKISILGLDKDYFLACEFENNLKENSEKLKFEFEKTLKKMTLFIDQL